MSATVFVPRTPQDSHNTPRLSNPVGRRSGSSGDKPAPAGNRIATAFVEAKSRAVSQRMPDDAPKQLSVQLHGKQGNFISAKDRLWSLNSVDRKVEVT